MKSLIYAVIEAAGAIDTAGTRILRPLGLTPMTFNILNVLGEGPLSQREISERVIVAASSITFQVRQLQKKGLIERRRADARTWRVSLTEKGRLLQAQANERMDAVIAGLVVDRASAPGAERVLRSIQSSLKASGLA